ncbi:MAG: HAMP domain-containing histidine kinase [Chloroflexota bacterium]|nr:HAMP domain-containing histidine kinase [Chloroflexota bacterium]
MPVRRRLALYGVSVAAAGMIVFIALLSGLGANGVRDDQDRTLTAMADAAAGALERGDATLTTTRPIVVTDLATSTDAFLLVLTPDGSVRYASALVNGAPPRVPAAVVVEANEQGRSVATVGALRIVARKFAGPAAGLVVAGQSTAVPANQLAGLRVFLAIAAIVTLIVVAIVSWLVAGRAVRPLVTLAQTTEAIGATGDLSRRLSLGSSHDEVGRLTTSFNAMIERLQSSQADLAAALAAQQRFVADASHELRTPLSTIRTNAEFLRERPDAAGGDRSEAIADLVSEAERMSRLVDGLLVLARADGKVAFDRRPVDLRAVATEEARRSRAPGRLRDGPTEVQVSSNGSALVSGDPDALGRAIRVLIDNAFRHGGPPVAITISRRDARIALEVRDAGPGLPGGSEERIFERFFRGDPARSGEGTGLGLSIARAIVEAHGGTIRAASPDSGGTAVTIELPAL